MKLSLNAEGIISFLVKHRAIVLLLFVLGFFISVAFSTFSYFSTKKRASISAQIAIGLTYLEEERSNIALIHFQNAFNKSDGLYGFISGAGIVRALKDDASYNQKAGHVLSIIKDYKVPTFIQMIALSSYLQNISHFNKPAFQSKDFEKLKKFSAKQGEPFGENITNINLNLNA